MAKRFIHKGKERVEQTTPLMFKDAPEWLQTLALMAAFDNKKSLRVPNYILKHDSETRTLSFFIDCNFIWADTAEGVDFWYSVSMNPENF